MRAFIILCCLATAYAASLGYDYERNSAPAIDIRSSFPAESGHAELSGPIAAAPAEFTKEFYTYSAPEHEFDDGAGQNQIANSLKKNLRVVFIKGPESNGLENAALQLARSTGDDRTAIYVLSKQADISDLANKLQQSHQQHANRPEVHFVKYRTPADAEHAQRAIQSQYSNLAGPSSSHDGGVAPVLNFASRAPAPVVQHGGSGYGSGPAEASNTYLPPNKRF